MLLLFLNHTFQWAVSSSKPTEIPEYTQHTSTFMKTFWNSQPWHKLSESLHYSLSQALWYSWKHNVISETSEYQITLSLIQTVPARAFICRLYSVTNIKVSVRKTERVSGLLCPGIIEIHLSKVKNIWTFSRGKNYSKPKLSFQYTFFYIEKLPYNI